MSESKSNSYALDSPSESAMDRPMVVGRLTQLLAHAAWIGLPGATAFYVAEALGTTIRAHVGPLSFVGTVAYSAFPIVVLATAVGLAIALGSSVIRHWSTSSSGTTEHEGNEPSPMSRSPSVLAAGVLAVVANYWVILWAATAFNNHQLASLLASVLVLGVTATALGAGMAISMGQQWATARYGAKVARRAVWGLLTLASGAALAGVLWDNRDGFQQLSPWLWMAALALVVAEVAALALGWAHRDMAPRLLGSLAFAAAALTFGIGATQPSLQSLLSNGPGWSVYVMRAVRAVTDLDGDGYSSFMGGGDCAAFDPNIHPGAYEVVGDAIDNNCVGGDAREGTGSEPVWYPLEPPLPRRMNVLFVSIETLRADHLSLYGYKRRTTPHMEALGRQAIVFENAYAPSTLTRLVLPSILSSEPPSKLPYDDPKQKGAKQRLKSSLTLFPEVLRRHGYRTVASHTNFRTFTRAHGIGIDQGFGVYDDANRLRYRGGTMQGWPGEGQVTRALTHVQKTPQPFFLWVHLVEPHFRYERRPGAPDFGDDDEDRYDSDIWEADRQLGRLLEALSERGLAQDTLVILCGDHGEEFGEHGKRFHGSNLFEPQLRTALVIRVPGVEPRRVDTAVSLSDIAPTLFNLLGLKQAFARTASRNLTPLLFGEEPARSWFVGELYARHNFDDYQAYVLNWPFKLLFTESRRTFALYDVKADAAEAHPLPATHPAFGDMKRLMIEHLERDAKRGDDPKRVSSEGSKDQAAKRP